MTYKNIHVSTFEAFFKSEDWRRNWIATNRPVEELAAHDKRMADRETKRNAFKVNFPFAVIMEGAYPEHDYVSRWCWQNIGSCDGECHEGEHSEYTGCPVVLATEHVVTGWYNTKDGKRVDWEDVAYNDVEDHSHVGNWCSLWLGKTGYDYGFTEYYFQTESDRDRFLAAAPTFNLGEKYKETTMNTVLEKAVHQSKWGFHSCSKEISKKLRFLNGVFAKAQHMAGAWERWERKLPQNRVVKRAIKDSKGIKIGTEVVLDAQGKPVEWKEPQVCDLFHDKIPSSVDRWGGKIGGRAEDNGFGAKILAASRQARTPQPTPEAVTPLLFSDEEIERLYNVAKDWLESR